LENAHWSIEKNILQDPIPGIMSFLMPLIHFIPKVISKKQLDDKAIMLDTRTSNFDDVNENS
jgi:hypothetical protein